MKILIEGPNGGGKSTLVDQLSLKYELNTFHPGPAPLNDSQATEMCMHQSLMYDIIMDRATCFSRLAYEHPDDLMRSHYNMLLRYCRDMASDTILILCVSQGDFTEKDYYPDGHFERVTKEAELIRCRYLKLFSRFKHFKFDFNLQTLKNVTDHINKRKEELNVEAN